MFRRLCLLLALLLPLTVSAQVKFASPLKRSTALSGTFAEVRTNHFHSGIDMRIDGKVGEPVYAPADGYVSRLRISSWDGGKMLYINHPGGITTVYLHLDGYADPIAGHVRRVQYGVRSYAIDTVLPPSRIPVRKGQLIAYAGNSGISAGPHLHFEVRNTATQFSLNPLEYGVPLLDTIAPAILGIRVIPATASSSVAGKAEGLTLSARQDSVEVCGSFYVGVYAVDASEGSTSRNGADRIDIWLDGEAYFQYHVDHTEYDKGRAVNAQIDYPHFLATRQPYIVTRRLPGDPTRYARTVGNGVMSFADQEWHRITVRVSDCAGNNTVRKFFVRNVVCPLPEIPRPTFDRETTVYPVSYAKANNLRRPDCQFSMPPGTIYADDSVLYSSATDARCIGKVHSFRLFRQQYPPHKTCKVRFPIPNGLDTNKLVVVHIEGKRFAAMPTLVTRGWLEAGVRVWGTFGVAVDNTPPTLKPLNFKAGKPFKRDAIRFKVGDNLSGIHRFHCYLNEVWVLAEYDGRSSTLSVPLNHLPKGALLNGKTNRLRLEVSDACGNTADATFQILIQR